MGNELYTLHIVYLYQNIQCHSNKMYIFRFYLLVKGHGSTHILGHSGML